MNLRDKSPEGNPSTVTIPLAVPRELLTVVQAPPDRVTQRNADAVLGITPRQFLDLLKEPGAPAVTKIGKLRSVDRLELLDWLRRRAVQGSPRARLALVPAELDGADAVLAELGLERVGGAR